MMKRGLSSTLNCHIVFDETDSSWQEKTRWYFTTQFTSSRRIIKPLFLEYQKMDT